MLDKNIFNTKKGFLFDMDGTIIDSMWMWEQIDIEYLGRYHIAYDKKLQREIEGKSFAECAAYFSEVLKIPETKEAMMAEWNRMAKDNYEHKVALKEGVRDFLEYAKKRQIPMGIATSNSRFLTDRVLQTLGVEEYFCSILTADEKMPGKPDPKIYLASAEAIGIPPCDCLVFEDVTKGIMAGQQAGMTVCAVYDPYNPEWEQTKARAGHFISSFTELLEETAL